MKNEGRQAPETSRSGEAGIAKKANGSGTAYAPHALVMPITSGLLLPLALFTLYSTSWETRVGRS